MDYLPSAGNSSNSSSSSNKPRSTVCFLSDMLDVLLLCSCLLMNGSETQDLWDVDEVQAGSDCATTAQESAAITAPYSMTRYEVFFHMKHLSLHVNYSLQ